MIVFLIFYSDIRWLPIKLLLIDSRNKLYINVLKLLLIFPSKEHCEKKKLCNTGTCVAQADSPGFTCTCPYGTCGEYCERTGCSTSSI